MRDDAAASVSGRACRRLRVHASRIATPDTGAGDQTLGSTRDYGDATHTSAAGDMSRRAARSLSAVVERRTRPARFALPALHFPD